MQGHLEYFDDECYFVADDDWLPWTDMFGLSAIKVLKFGLSFNSTEVIVLFVGMVVAFVVSILVIKFLMSYIKRHDFKLFGWYRIVLGIIVLVYFFFL